MSSHTRPKLTAGEISGLLGIFPVVAGTVLAFFLTNTFRQWREGNFGIKPLRRNVVASFGTVISLLNPRQVRVFVSHTTGEVIADYCAARDLCHQSVLVKNDDGFQPARLHFIDSKLEERGPILLYFHGGGFIVPLHSPAFAISLARTARASPVLLEYSLAPDCVYPGQLSQSIAALRLILQYRRASEVIIGGESAGGNMALAIMAHLQQPKPGITPLVLSPPPRQQKLVKFRGVLVISPRTANIATAESYRTNSGKDFMSEHSLGAITASWKPEAEVWAAPVMAQQGFWDGLRAERVLVVVGGDEVYRDDVCHTARVMGAKDVEVVDVDIKAKATRKDSPAMQLVVCPGELHCQASLDMSVGIKDGYMTRGVARWLAGFGSHV